MALAAAEKKKLTRFAEAPDWQAKVDEQKQKLRQMGPPDKIKLARFLSNTRARKEKLEDMVSVCNVEIEASQQMLIELLDDEGITSFKDQDGFNFIQKIDVYVAIQDKEAFYAWIKKKKMTDLFSVNYQTAAALVKEKMENGEPNPPGTKAFLKESITIRKPVEKSGG